MAATAQVEILSAGRTNLWLKPGPDFLTLSAAYRRWQDDGLFAAAFAANPEMSLDEFLEWTYQPTVDCAAVMDGDDLIGAGWMFLGREVAGKVVVQVGAAFFKGTSLSQWRRGLDLLVDYSFEDRGVDAIYGLSPYPNRWARALAARAGVEEVGCLPLFGEWMGEAVDMRVYALKRADWRRMRDERR